MKNTDTQKKLMGLKPFPAKNYQSLDLDRMAIYVLYALEEQKVPLYFDNVSVGLFRIFPKKFSMANFSQYPDTSRIDKALRRLTDAKRKRWATGTVENAFNLTDLGREVARQTLHSLNNPELQKLKRPIVSKSRGKSSVEEVHEIRESETFKKWNVDPESVTNHEIFAFLKAAPYTPKELLTEHLKKLKVSASESKDSEVKDFLNWTERKLLTLFN
jgi:hypothetical protein